MNPIIIILVVIFVYFIYNIKYEHIQNIGRNDSKNFANSIYENPLVNNSYDTDTIYDKLVDVFSKQENKFYNCEQAYVETQENYIKELNMVFKLVAVPLIVFNREVKPVTRDFLKTDENNKLLPIAQSAIDVFNEKLNKTCIITDIQDIEILTSEEQKQFTFFIYINYPTVNKDNYPIIKNLKIKMVLIRRRLIKDDIFAPNKYDTSKFVIKEMKLIDSTNIKNNFKIQDTFDKYYDYDQLMRETGEFTNENLIDTEMLRNRKKHEHEMDFRNIMIEDDNYLNDYMIPHKACKP